MDKFIVSVITKDGAVERSHIYHYVDDENMEMEAANLSYQFAGAYTILVSRVTHMIVPKLAAITGSTEYRWE